MLLRDFIVWDLMPGLSWNFKIPVERINLADYKKRIMIVNVTATYLGPTIQGLPHFSPPSPSPESS